MSIYVLGIWIAIILVLLVTAGAVVGALIGTNVIRVGSKSDSASDTSSDSGSGTGGADGSGSSPGGGPSTAGQATATATSGSSAPKPTTCTKPESIPSTAKGTSMDPTSWLDMTDFNCTFTDKTVGGLPIVGLNSTWDDSARANQNVPRLNQKWGSYATRPIRGVSIGGWLSLEPFITPSLFSDSLVDEYSLCKHLGKDAASTLEKHYSTFITERDFKRIADSGLDHVRIPFSYWAVRTYEGDPYVASVSWRYLLRGIEWARRYGLRVKLDLHGMPGSQNGWNHSGRQGTVGWLVGPDGKVNAQRTLDIHDQLSKFFAQDRYKNVVALYGLGNEPAKVIPQDALIEWTEAAYKIVHDNGVGAIQVFSEAIRGLEAWKGKLQGHGDNLVVDVHEYTIFDDGLIGLKHSARVDFACTAFAGGMTSSMDTSTGFGPTIVGEWSQADTDCTLYLNGVGNGARWAGTFFSGDGGPEPKCPTLDSRCDCDKANADPSTFSRSYKLFLQTWAEAQMSAFEKSWGWFYWTWKTETAYLWSYEAGLDGEFLPALAYKPDWDCSKPVPSFGDLPEFY